MKKSQAPSFRKRIVLKSSEGHNGVIISQKANADEVISSEKNARMVRNTESVLNLITNSYKTDNSENSWSSETDCGISDEKLNFCQNVTSDEKMNDLISPYEEEDKIEETSTVAIYNVVYGKPTKRKNKTWEGDGTLEVGSKYISLKDENGKVIGNICAFKSRKLEEGDRLFVGSKEVELIEFVNTKSSESNNKSNQESLPSVMKEPLKKKNQIPSRKFTCPKSSYCSGLALPEPSALHQWYFNKDGLPLTPVFIEESLSKKLRQHQYTGICFLYECIMGFREKTMTGAVLADEMGLGKTLQCITLIWTLLKQGPYGKPVLKKVLIVTPSSLTMNWCNEFIKWLGRHKLVPFVVDAKNKPSQMKGSVMIISYEMFSRYFEDVEQHKFDLMICDEGHRLKNSNIRTTQLLSSLNCSRKIILTGTPIQNDLQEFFSLVDFVNPKALGTPTEFRRVYEEPILASRQPNASEDILSKGRERAQELKRITSMFLLRRTQDVLESYLPPRHEIVVFCKITEAQKDMYNSMIELYLSSKESDLCTADGSFHLELISSLKKLCSHPLLLQKENNEQNDAYFSKSIFEMSVIDDSGKIRVTINILREIKETSPREKVVLVSNSTKTLNLLGKILTAIGYSTSRLDGSTPVNQRNNIVDSFNSSYRDTFVFLLSSKAGGVGLNLTGASRLILFDSDWNPATDLQSVSRIWRDGQKYPVFVYRLLSTGTIEEKIYQRQIVKQDLYNGIVDYDKAKSIKLSKEELKDIFMPCEIEEDCLIHVALDCACSKRGEIPVPEIELEERNCQLMKERTSLKICELFHWEHHGSPFNSELLSELCLKSSEKYISFIFRTCKV